MAEQALALSPATELTMLSASGMPAKAGKAVPPCSPPPRGPSPVGYVPAIQRECSAGESDPAGLPQAPAHRSMRILSCSGGAGETLGSSQPPNAAEEFEKENANQAPRLPDLPTLQQMQFEVEMILRVRIASAHQLDNAVNEACELLGFIHHLKCFSASPASPTSNTGSLFQLITDTSKSQQGQISGETSIASHSWSSSLDDQNAEVDCCDETKLVTSIPPCFANSANKLCRFLKIKISDTGDLETANTILRDCLKFFAMLEEWATESGHHSLFESFEALKSAETA